MRVGGGRIPLRRVRGRRVHLSGQHLHALRKLSADPVQLIKPGRVSVWIADKQKGRSLLKGTAQGFPDPFY